MFFHSPDNIFITNDGRAVLIDFGSVRSYVYTDRMTTILKRGYAPLEQYREKGVFGPWTDIYALSVTIYRLLSGVMPPESISRVLDDKLIPLEKLVNGLPEGVYVALEGGLKIDHEKRTQSLEKFRSQLFEGGLPNPEPHPHPHPQPHPQPQPQPQPMPMKGKYISFEGGCFKGRRVGIGKSPIVFGRIRECNIIFPPNTVGVSKKHCCISYVKGQLCIMDLNSTYGTYVNNYKLQPMRWYRLKQTSKVVIGNEAFIVYNN